MALAVAPFPFVERLLQLLVDLVEEAAQELLRILLLEPAERRERTANRLNSFNGTSDADNVKGLDAAGTCSKVNGVKHP